MKIFKHILLAAAAVAAIACSEEISPEPIGKPGSNLISMTFTANSDTGVDSKIMYDGESKTTWKTGDVITIVSESGFASEFEAVSVSDDGKTAEFQGETEASDKYYAVYPSTAYKGNDFDAPVTADNPRLYVNVPEVQTAVAGTFDPKAFVSIATNRGSNLSFKNLCSVVKFNLNDASGVKSIRFCMTSNTNLAGTGSVHIKSTTTHSWGEDIKVNGTSIRYSSNMITLNAPAAGFDNNTDYYFVQRVYEQSKDTDKPDGVQFYLEYEDHVKTRTGVNAFDASRNKVVPVGTIDEDDKVQDLTPYEAYDLGFDIMIAGVRYNKNSLNLTANLVNQNDQVISSNGIYFINDDITNITIPATTFNKLYVIGNDYNNRSNITLTGQVRGNSKSVLGFKNINITSTSNDHLFVNYATQADPIDRIALDNCAFEVPSANGKVVMYNGAAKGFNSFVLHNCDIKVTADGQKFIFIAAPSTGIENYGSLDFYNNIFYSQLSRNDFYIIQSTKAIFNNFSFVKNTLVNTYYDNSNGYIQLYALKDKYIFEYNLFELGDIENTDIGDNRWLLRCMGAETSGVDKTEYYPANTSFISNYFYSGPNKIVNVQYSRYINTDKITSNTSSSLDYSDFENCIFEKKSDFEHYGATR